MGQSVIIIPGWGESAGSMRRLRITIEDITGRTVMTPKYSRLTFPTAARAMAARLETLQLSAERLEGPVTLLSHSMGALDAVSAARANPIKFPHIILASPAGLTDPVALHRVAGRFAAKTMHDTFGQWRVATGIIARNPLLALAEGRAVSRTDLRPLLRDLADSGVRISILAARSDSLFSVEHLRDLLAKPHANIELIEIEGTHDSVHLGPDEYRDTFRRLFG